MDKYEYKLRAEEIRERIAEGDYFKAAELADAIDWSRVKKAGTLCTISDLYKKVRRYDDALELLQLAYERYPGGKDICYALCELYIKTGEFISAIASYKEFVQVAPRDTRRYILLYRLYEAQDVSLEERIEVLEEFKSRDYREKWAYELAFLYHRVGLGTRCIEECDEMIAWFGTGRYVYKAMELKAMHEPLRPDQQEKFDRRFETNYGEYDPDAIPEQIEENADGVMNAAVALESGDAVLENGVQKSQPVVYTGNSDVVTPAPGMISTGNMALDAAIAEALAASEAEEAAKMQQTGQSDMVDGPEAGEGMDALQGDVQEMYQQPADEIYEEMPYSEDQETNIIEETDHFYEGEVEELPDDGYGATIDASTNRRVVSAEEAKALALGHTRVFHGLDEEEPNIDVRPVDVSACNTMNLQNMVAEGMKDIWEDEMAADLDPINLEPTGKIIDRKAGKVVYASDTDTLEEPAIEDVSEDDLDAEIASKHKAVENAEVFFSETGEMTEIVPEDAKVVYPSEKETSNLDVVSMMEAEMRGDTGVFQAYNAAQEAALVAQPPETMAEVLTQEPDGQLSLVLPESQKLDKQITGQINLTDVLQQWDRMKQDREDKNREALHQQVFERTGPLFTEFDQSIMNSLLDQIERESRENSEEDDSFLHDGIEADDQVEELEEIREGEFYEDDAMPNQEAQSFETVEQQAEKANADITEEEAAGDAPEQDDLEELDTFEELDSADESTAEESTADESTEKENPEEENPDESSNVELDNASENDEEASVSDVDEMDGFVDSPVSDETCTIHLRCDKNLTPSRELSKEEKELFGPFIQTRSAKAQLVNVLDNVSLAPYAGNLILTGDDGIDVSELASGIMKELKEIDANFTGYVGTIEGGNVTPEKIEKAVNKLNNGALLINKASLIPQDVVSALSRCLEKENFGIVVALIDNRRNMERFLENNPALMELFDVRMHVEALSDDRLVAFGKQYARSREFTIDAMGELALHTQIDIRQASDHAVTVVEVKEIVDQAIRHASKKTPKHFFDVLFGKRYDNEDMIVLGEKDFV